MIIYMKQQTSSTNIGTKIGITVKRLREEQQLSQEQLREKAGLASGYISRLEAGEYSAPSINHTFSLATALGMTLRDLLEQAGMIKRESTFESCLRGEGGSLGQVKEITNFKNYVLSTTQSTHSKNA
jgi:transcriptional regulator with XRE-family HTH domain